ncbi:hypothetical protein [Prevotella jejuni]
MILFPQRIDKDIAEDDPVRLLDALVDNLMLYNVYKLYKPSSRKYGVIYNETCRSIGLRSFAILT